MDDIDSDIERRVDSFSLKKKKTIIQPKRLNTMLRRHESDETMLPNFLSQTCYGNQLEIDVSKNMMSRSRNGMNLVDVFRGTEKNPSLCPLRHKTLTSGSTLALKKNLTKNNIPVKSNSSLKQMSRQTFGKIHTQIMKPRTTLDLHSDDNISDISLDASLPKSQIDFIPFVKNGVKSFCFHLSCDPIFADKLLVLPATTLEYMNVCRLQNSCGELHALREVVLTRTFITKAMLATFLELRRYHSKCRVALHENIQKDLLEDYKALGAKPVNFLKHRPHIAAINNLATYLLGESEANKLELVENCRILPYAQKKKKTYWDTKLWCHFFQKKKREKKKKKRLSKSVVVYKLGNLNLTKSVQHDSISNDISVHYSSNFSSSNSSLTKSGSGQSGDSHKTTLYEDTVRKKIELRDTSPNVDQTTLYETIQPSFGESDHSAYSFTSHRSNALREMISDSSEVTSFHHLLTVSDHTLTKIGLSKKLSKRFQRIKLELNRLHCTTRCKLQCNSLFQCASMNLFGTRDYHIWVRHHVVAHMSDMRDRYLSFFPSENFFIKYLFEMSDKNTCGDFLCLRAIADTFVCSMHVIIQRETIRHFTYYPVDANNQTAKPLRHLLFCHVYPTYYFDFCFGIP